MFNNKSSFYLNVNPLRIKTVFHLQVLHYKACLTSFTFTATSSKLLNFLVLPYLEILAPFQLIFFPYDPVVQYPRLKTDLVTSQTSMMELFGKQFFKKLFKINLFSKRHYYDDDDYYYYYYYHFYSVQRNWFFRSHIYNVKL